MEFNNITINKKNIDFLLSKFSINDIESALIELFIEENSIAVNNNKIIKDLIKYNENTNEIKSYIKNFQYDINLKFIERVFELLIPKEDRETNGAFFTPSFIIKYIINETIQGDQKVCDPSCGCGGFLIEATKKIHEITKKSLKEIIENNIYGCDILDYSIKRTKILLSLLMLEYGEDCQNVNFNLITEDSLLIDWNNFFPDLGLLKGLYKFTGEDSGFDVIVGNPPYLRIQDLDNVTKENLLKKWDKINKGNFNIYFAFFYLGMELLNSNGKLGYITPNNYFTSLSAKNLRKWILPKVEKIIDFKHLKIFNDVSTYTCISILSKSKKEYLQYKTVQNEGQILDIFNDNNFSKIYYDNIDYKKWRLLQEADFENIKKIESIGTKLGDLTNIKNGIATLRDKLYFIDSSDEDEEFYYISYNKKRYPIEKDITTNILKVSTVKNEEDIKNNSLKIILPYVYSPELKIIEEEILKSEFPKCYEYLLDIKEELDKRDKGKKKYETWYAYGRKQGLGFNQEKLLTPTFSKKPRFLKDLDKSSLYCNGYGIFLKNNSFSLNVLQKILNSVVMEYYINKTSVNIEGGFPCFQKNFIELFSIPNLTVEEKEFLENEEDLEKINMFLIKKYELDLDLIKV